MRILVIDDEQDVLNVCKKILVEKKGIDGRKYKVDLEINHEKALKRLEKEYFDILIVDMTSKTDAYAGLEIIKQILGTYTSPVTIVFTGYPSIENCVEAMRLGAWDYIGKESKNDDAYEKLINSIQAGCKYKNKYGLGKPDPSAQWIDKNMKDLVNRYPGEYIAVLNQKVISHHSKLVDVNSDIKQKKYLVKPYVFFIPENWEVVE